MRHYAFPAEGATQYDIRPAATSRASSLTSSVTCFSTTFIHLCLPALYIKLSPPDCLTLVGREGRASSVARSSSTFPSQSSRRVAAHPPTGGRVLPARDTR